MSEAFKTDDGKLRIDLVPVTAIRAMARGLGYGLNKYPARNWEAGMAYGRLYGALLRHLTAWWDGEEMDPESGLSHLDHVLCCAAMLEGTVTGGLGEDDRPGRAKREVEDKESLEVRMWKDGAPPSTRMNIGFVEEVRKIYHANHDSHPIEECWQCRSNER